jgi:hypothetical protein
VNAERQLLMQLEHLSRMDAPDRSALTAAESAGELRETLHVLERLECIHVPEPSLDAMWQGRTELLAAVQQPSRRFAIMSEGIFSGRLAQGLPAALLAAVVVATTAGGAAVAGVGAPRVPVNEVLSTLGLKDQAVRPVTPSPASPVASPLQGQDNSVWPPVDVPVGLPGPDETPGGGPQTPATSGQKPRQSADSPGHGGENPRQGVGPEGSGTPPGHGGENPGQGVVSGPNGTPTGQRNENPGEGQENQGKVTPPPSQGNGSGKGHSSKP